MNGWATLGVAVISFLAGAVPAGAAWEDRLTYESAGGDFAIGLGGRLHADMARIDADRPPGEHTDEEFRRARLNLSGRVFEDWRFRYEHDFAAEQDSRIKDAYVGYYGLQRARLRAGNLQAPLSLEELTSSNAITFMERALPNALVRGYSLGILAESWDEDWSAAIGWFEGRIEGREPGVDEGWALAGRATRSTLDSVGRRLHFGAYLEYREPPGDERVSFSSRPEVHLTDNRLVSTGTLSSVDYTLTGGVELAGVWGPWSLQGEYVHTAVERSGREDVAFQGWYLLGSWFITGGQRDYDAKNGTFDPVRPRGEWGAWELAVRYSVLDLQDAPITGGEERNWTLGLNWYFNRNTRLMLNWVDAKADPNGDGQVERLEALQARFQFHF